MKFTVNAKELVGALTDTLLKGKYLTGGGLSGSSLPEEFYAELEGNTLSLWNADIINSLVVKINLEVEGEKNGSFTAESKLLIQYLKKFSGDVEIESGDILTIKSENSKVSQPLKIEHTSDTTIKVLKPRLEKIHFEENLETLFEFGKGKFEGAFQLDSNTFADYIKLCELVGSGVYSLNYEHDKNKVSLSSSSTNSNRFETFIELESNIGESATIDFCDPVHALFKDEVLNFYLKDDFPMLIVGENKILMKAPRISD